MKIRPTVPALLVFAFAALLFAAGCDRFDNPVPQTAEVDEPGYRRGKELERQGRNLEAIIEFNKVLAKRGLDNAPETNLELGILILDQRMDPTAAIFHFNKYRQTRLNPDRDELVKQRIEVAKREFARMLPGRPSFDTAAATTTADIDVVELNNRIQALQAENERLRAAIANNSPAANTIFSSAPPAGVSVAPQPQPLSAAPASQAQPARVQAQAQQQQQLQQSRPQQQTQQAQASQPRATSRTYAVKPHDNLFSIARQFYGTASNAQVEAIANANRDVLPAGRNTPLREGMVLKLP